MIGNFHKNSLGTVSFDAKFKGMKKTQDFIVYPIKAGDPADTIVVQSDTRIGTIHMTTGEVVMSKSHAGGAYFMHLQLEGTLIDTISQEDLLLLRANVFATASGRAGTNGIVFTDNSGALEVFA